MSPLLKKHPLPVTFFSFAIHLCSSPIQIHKSLGFEYRHNRDYRYSKLKGKTPLTALAESKKEIIFPDRNTAPEHPLKKPEEGFYTLVRFIRSDCRLNIFSEIFLVPPEAQYEYVVATVDVKEQKIKLFLDTIQIEEYKYQLRT